MNESYMGSMGDDDCFIYDYPNGEYRVKCGGKFIGTVQNYDDALMMIDKWMSSEGSYPEVWHIGADGELIAENRARVKRKKKLNL